MRDEKLYLQDILNAAASIEAFLRNETEHSFAESDLLKSAVLHKLTIIGEAAAKISKDFRQEHQDIPWSDIVGFRNIAIHSYFSVQWPIVWVAATQETPELRRKLQALLNDYIR